jgi:ABC-2 type transport system ATP-binding protein
MRRPTLDDVFLRLTGHIASVENDDATGAKGKRTQKKQTQKSEKNR